MVRLWAVWTLQPGFLCLWLTGGLDGAQLPPPAAPLSAFITRGQATSSHCTETIPHDADVTKGCLVTTMDQDRNKALCSHAWMQDHNPVQTSKQANATLSWLCSSNPLDKNLATRELLPVLMTPSRSNKPTSKITQHKAQPLSSFDHVLRCLLSPPAVSRLTAESAPKSVWLLGWSWWSLAGPTAEHGEGATWPQSFGHN